MADREASASVDTSSASVGSHSVAVGLGGTGFAGLVSLFPNHILKSVLLILAPSITIIINLFWKAMTAELGTQLADWKVRREIRKLEVIMGLANVSSTVKQQAKTALQSIIKAQVVKRKQTAERILSSS